MAHTDGPVTAVYWETPETLIRQAELMALQPMNGGSSDTFISSLALLDKALKLEPGCIDAVVRKAAVLVRLGHHAAASRVFEEHYREGSPRPDFLNLYGFCLQSEGRYEDAIIQFRTAISICPDQVDPLYNCGTCLQILGNYLAAEMMYDRVLAIEPAHSHSLTCRGMIHLSLGRFTEGWSDYEWRKQLSAFSGRVITRQPLTRERISGNRVFLHAEQGTGDTFHFVRYASIIKALGAREVIVECQDGLRNVVATCPGVDTVYERCDCLGGPHTNTYDVQANLMSVPCCLSSRTIDDIPSQVPYLSACPDKSAYWKQRIGELTPVGTRLKVGIAWAGDPRYTYNNIRSTALSQFERLSSIDGLVCFSVQKGSEAVKELDNPPTLPPIIPLGNELEGFDDTAGVLDNLDLVISVDTSVVHLAGALGLPVWTLLSKDPDWRWMLDRDDSPWYPTMHLFRQREMLRWEPVFDEVAQELELFANDPVLWHMESAKHKFEAGNRDLAKVHLLAMSRRHPTDTRLLNTLATVLWTDGNLEEAAQIVRAALMIDRNNPATIANCACILRACDMHDDAHMLVQAL